MRVGECKVGDKRVVPSKPALLSKPALPRSRRSRIKYGRPLTTFGNIDQAKKMKMSVVRILHTEFSCASAILTACERLKFKEKKENDYQHCR